MGKIGVGLEMCRQLANLGLVLWEIKIFEHDAEEKAVCQFGGPQRIPVQQAPLFRMDFESFPYFDKIYGGCTKLRERELGFV